MNDDLLQEYVAPRSTMEKKICQTFSEVLHMEQVGIDHDFVACGGTSADAFKAQNIIQFPLIDANIIFQERTPRRILELVLEKIANGESIREKTPCFWYEPYDSGKPTIVVACGIVPIKLIPHKMARLKETFNIFVFWPVFDFYDSMYKGKNTRELTDIYYDMLYRALDGNVHPHAFLGYSWGGELALRLAIRYEQERGVSPMLYLGDTQLLSKRMVDMVKDSHDVKAKLMADMDYKALKVFKRRFDIVLKMSVIDNLSYSGDAVLFSPTDIQDDLYDEQMRLWRATVKGTLEVIRLKGDHNTINTREEYNDLIADKILSDYAAWSNQRCSDV